MKKRNGFTLIELLVVIAIISLLVSILLPSLNRAKEMAKKVVCQTNLKSLNVAFNYYCNDNNGLLPPGFGFLGSGTDGWPVWWSWYLSGLAGDGTNYLETSIYDTSNAGNVFRCPEANMSNESNAWSYAMPAGLSSVNWTLKHRSVDDIKQPSLTALLLDSWGWIPVTDYWVYEVGGFTNDSNRRTLRHDEKTTDNFLFIDGHVESLADGEELDSEYIVYYAF